MKSRHAGLQHMEKGKKFPKIASVPLGEILWYFFMVRLPHSVKCHKIVMGPLNQKNRAVHIKIYSI